MYEGLREGLRDATRVRLETTFNPEMEEGVFELVRGGESLWKMTATRKLLMQMKFSGEMHRIAWEQGQKIVDEILDQVNWDEFFPIEKPKPSGYLERAMRLYEGGLIVLDEFTRARRIEQLYSDALDAIRKERGEGGP